jgi:hypothetical protein
VVRRNQDGHRRQPLGAHRSRHPRITVRGRNCVPDYLAKLWTRYEFRGIVSMNVYGKQNLLPIWHRITKDEVPSICVAP